VSWRAALAALVAVRVAIPVVVLAAGSRDLEVVPAYDYGPFYGDANAYYATVREFVAAVPRVGAVRLTILALGVVAVALAARRLRPAWLRLAAPAAAVSLAIAVVVDEMVSAGGPVFGWPLLWSLPAFPLRALGLLDPDSAFAAGLALSLAATGVTVVATAFLGRDATGLPAVGLGAAALYAFWPLLTAPLAGTQAWENGQWFADTGLLLYTEPLSTALATVAAAVLVAPRRHATRDCAAGLLLGLATAAKLSNGILALLALAWLLRRDRGTGRALPLAAGGLTVLPIVAAYWQLGYATIWDDPNVLAEPPFALDYAVESWADSLLFGPRALVLLAPLALLGAWSLRRRPALPLLAGWILATAAFYTFYSYTSLHPRFLYVVLPELFVLEAAGAYALVRLTVRNS
jgi:hypothetical protein